MNVSASQIDKVNERLLLMGKEGCAGTWYFCKDKNASFLVLLQPRGTFI